MKNYLRKSTGWLSIVIIFIMICSFKVYSQSSIEPDSVKIGKSYKFIMFDDKEYIGKVLSVDSDNIKITSNNTAYKLNKDDIFSITRSSTLSVYTAVIGARGGFTILGQTKYGRSDIDKLFRGYNLAVEGVFPIDEKKGVRVDLLYNHIFRNYNNDPSHNYQYQYDDVQMYSFSTDIVLGDFRTKNKFYYYFNAGAGMHIIDEGSYIYSYYNTQNQYVSQTIDMESKIGFFMNIGATAGVKLSKKVGAFMHLQFNCYGVRNEVIFFGRESHLPVSAGISYFF